MRGITGTSITPVGYLLHHCSIRSVASERTSLKQGNGFDLGMISSSCRPLFLPAGSFHDWVTHGKILPLSASEGELSLGMPLIWLANLDWSLLRDECYY